MPTTLKMNLVLPTKFERGLGVPTIFKNDFVSLTAFKRGAGYTKYIRK